MEFEEFKKRFNAILEKPDDLDAAKKLTEDMKAEFAARDETAKKAEEQEGKIRDLQDTNMKLYLAQTATPDEEEETEEEEPTFEELLFKANEEEE